MPASLHRRLAVELFDHSWSLLGKPERTQAENDELVHTVPASAYHWSKVGTVVNVARGETSARECTPALAEASQRSITLFVAFNSSSRATLDLTIGTWHRPSKWLPGLTRRWGMSTGPSNSPPAPPRPSSELRIPTTGSGSRSSFPKSSCKPRLVYSHHGHNCEGRSSQAHRVAPGRRDMG